jgi:hypothetical protein
MSDYDWQDIGMTLGQIAGGEELWSGSRKEAHGALCECRDAIVDSMGELGFEADLPHIGDRPDWRRMPDKARALIEAVKLIRSHTPGEAPDSPSKAPPVPDDEPDLSELAASVLARLEEGGGVTMSQLTEVTESPEGDIRGAIKELRARYQSDAPLHPVNWRSKWWTAKELSAMGKDLQPTARGTLKVVTTPRENKPGPAGVPEGTKKLLQREITEEIQQLLEDHPDAERLWMESLARMDEFFAAKENLADVRKATREKTERAKENMKDAAKQERDGNDADAAAVKLHSVEMAVQAWEEAEAEATELRKEARERAKRADMSLRTFKASLKQLELPHT